MFRYAFKKAFFDLWDHLAFNLTVNLGYTLIVLGLFLLGHFLAPLGAIAMVLYVPIPFLGAAILGGLVTFWARDAVVEGSTRFSRWTHHIAASWKPSLFFGGAWIILAIGEFLGVPFYTHLHPWAGIGFGVVMLWLLFFGAGMSLYYPGLNAQVEPLVSKLVRKSFLLFVANPLTSFVMALVTIVLIALSVVTLGFFPGIFGVSVWLQVCFRFLMTKYEWLEAEPDADHRKVPWNVLLADEMAKVGHRTLRGMIFPWKD